MSKKKKYKKNPDVYDYHEGKEVSQSDRDKWILEILLKLKDNMFYHISSGNSIVIGMRSDEDITIIEVDNGYREYIHERKL